LGIFDKTLENVICLVGDNCNANIHLADICNLPFIGCASHRFNLEVQAFLTQYEPLLEKVVNIIISIYNILDYHIQLVINYYLSVGCITLGYNIILLIIWHLLISFMG
jgi:hypothetical protein